MSLGIDQKRKVSPKRKFSAGCPCGHPAKNFGQTFPNSRKKKQAFGTAILRGRLRKNFRLKNLGLVFRFLIEMSANASDTAAVRCAIRIAVVSRHCSVEGNLLSRDEKTSCHVMKEALRCDTA